jgi:Rho-type GTPase-activating protein 1/2
MREALTLMDSLCFLRSSGSLAAPEADETVRLSKALSVRFDNIKHQYQSDLLPLTAQKESFMREIAELRASRDAYLEETTMLSARNEELAQLHAKYLQRLDAASDNSSDLHGRDSSLDKARAPPLSSSVTSSTTAFSDESQPFVNVQKPAEVVDATPVPKSTKFKWPGSRSQPMKEHAPGLPGSVKPKPRIEHGFQQVNALRVARCDHCGDKMWGSIMRCGSEWLSPQWETRRCTNVYFVACSTSVHHRCVQLVHLPCSQQAGVKEDRPVPQPAGKYHCVIECDECTHPLQQDHRCSDGIL